VALKNGVEVYIRPSGNRVLLNFYVPAALRRKFVDALKSGSFDNANVPIHFEITPLPEWSSNGNDRARLSKLDPVHMRIPLAAINVSFTEDDDA
jgi:hypothetical protein